MFKSSGTKKKKKERKKDRNTLLERGVFRLSLRTCVDGLRVRGFNCCRVLRLTRHTAGWKSGRVQPLVCWKTSFRIKPETQPPSQPQHKKIYVQGWEDVGDGKIKKCRVKEWGKDGYGACLGMAMHLGSRKKKKKKHTTFAFKKHSKKLCSMKGGSGKAGHKRTFTMPGHEEREKKKME